MGYDNPSVIKTNDAGSATPGIPATGGIGAVFAAYVPFTALTTGAADDVTVVASMPCKAKIIDVLLHVSTAVSSETATLRSAAAGGGSALSSALSVNATGHIRDAITSGAPTVAAGSAIYLRRSDRAAAGAVTVLFQEVQ